jgi:hypothetical protein
MKRGLGRDSMRFGALADITARHVLVDIPVDRWPPVLLKDQFHCLMMSWVSYQGGIVVFSNDLLPEVSVDRDIDMISE